MRILVGLIPAVLWGLAPLLLNRFVKGGPYVQMAGVANGITVLSAVITLLTRPAVPGLSDWLLCFLSGAGWNIGMLGQMIGYQTIGVSRTFPLSTGIQIIGNALLGWLVLGEWQGARQITEGLLFTALVMAGVLISSGRKKASSAVSATSAASGAAAAGSAQGKLPEAQNSRSHDLRDTLLVAVTSFGYCVYTLLPKLTRSTTSLGQSLPQSLGILACAIVLFLLAGTKRTGKPSAREVSAASAVGLWYGAASFAFLLSISLNGMIRGFLLSQLNMVIATLSGIYLIHEPQTVPLWRSYAAIAAILVGCIAIQFI